MAPTRVVTKTLPPLVISIAVGALLLTLGGCGGGSQTSGSSSPTSSSSGSASSASPSTTSTTRKPTSSPTPTPTKTTSTIYVTSLPSTVTTNIGQQIKVQLPATPSSGYEWNVAPGSPQIVNVSGPTYRAPTTNKPGAPGTSVFTLTVKAAGTQTLTFSYSEQGGGVDAKSENLTVRAS